MELETTEYKPKLMDHIFCAGDSKISRWIQWYNRHVLHMTGDAATISHVASIWRRTPYRNYVSVFESTSLNKWSDQTGVQLNRLSTWLRHYNGKVYAKRITEAEINEVRVWDFIQANKDREYESGIPGAIELITTGFTWPWWPKWLRTKPTGEVHCSEIISELDQRIDLLPDTISPHKFPPARMWQYWKGEPTWRLK